MKAYIAARVAKELQDGNVVNLGIGLPTLVPNFLPDDVRVVLHSENGIINTGTRPDPFDAWPMHVVDAGGQPSSVVSGGCFIDSSVLLA